MNYMRKAKRMQFSIYFIRSVNFYKNGKKKYATILKSLKKEQSKSRKTNKQKNSIITKLDLFYECKIG